MLIETLDYKGHEIKIHTDEDPQSPDDWRDDSLFLVFDHRSFTIRRQGFDPKDIFVNGSKGYHVFQLYAYIHSGVTLSLDGFSCPWDTSDRGFVLVSKKEFKEKQQARKAAEGLIKDWNMYLHGEVYGYESKAGSCWGFYGEAGKEEMINEAKAEIDWLIMEEIKKKLKRAKALIKNKVKLIYR